MSKDYFIRTVNENDAQELLNIYSPYVNNTAITFEYDVPSIVEFKKRINMTLNKYPYIAIIKEDKIVGYAYASMFHEREAYSHCVETSIYIKNEFRGQGFGKAIYLALEDILKKQNVFNLNACIAYAPTEDEYLTNDSEKFHKHLGYKTVGRFTRCGYKFNRWYDMIWMEKLIDFDTNNVEPFIPFSELEHKLMQPMEDISIVI